MTTAPSTNATKTLSNAFTHMFMAFFSALVVLGGIALNTAPAEAYSAAYNQGYAKGKATGRTHGYQDGYEGAYKASYVDTLINGSKYARADASSGRLCTWLQEGLSGWVFHWLEVRQAGRQEGRRG